MTDVQNPAELSRPAAPRADVAAFELLTQALVGITTQSLDALDGAVTVSQFRLLRTLDGLGRVPSSALAAALQTAASSVTRLVDKLEAAGFVARGTDDSSRSIVTVEVTDAGHAVVEHVLTRRHTLLQAVLDAMDPAERDHAATAAARFAQLAGDAVARRSKRPGRSVSPQPHTPQASLSARAASTQPNTAPAVLPGRLWDRSRTRPQPPCPPASTAPGPPASATSPSMPASSPSPGWRWWWARPERAPPTACCG